MNFQNHKIPLEKAYIKLITLAAISKDRCDYQQAVILNEVAEIVAETYKSITADDILGGKESD